jgi:hypothetical protein
VLEGVAHAIDDFRALEFATEQSAERHAKAANDHDGEGNGHDRVANQPSRVQAYGAGNGRTPQQRDGNRMHRRDQRSHA